MRLRVKGYSSSSIAGFALANSASVVALPRLVPEEEVGALVSTHHALRGIALPVGAALGGLHFQHVGDHAPFVPCPS